jgi:hypothetical protein
VGILIDQNIGAKDRKPEVPYDDALRRTCSDAIAKPEGTQPPVPGGDI